jgi:ATP-dependent RNA/DNA helicase IGHMBP2
MVGSGPYTLIPRSFVQVHQKLLKSLDTLEKYGVDHSIAGRIIRDIFEKEGQEQSTIPDGHDNADDNGQQELTPFNPNLDSSQMDAIRFALFGKQPISLIHGPPGTGKTTTVAELIHQAVFVNQCRVLVTAPSNIAVDNILERLVVCMDGKEEGSKKGKGVNQRGGSNNRGTKLRAVRMGHPARIQSSILHYSLEYLVQNAHGTEIVNDIRNEMKSYMKLVSNPKTRGMERRDAYREMRLLKKEIRQREEKVVESLLKNAQVVLCTNVGASSSLLDRLEKSGALDPFDLVVIDEAAQALEVSCWAPIFRGKRIVLAGDHCQLPPTIKCHLPHVQRALSRTLFERIMERGEAVSRMLRVQYRMHEDIAEWSSRAMYDGRLTSHESVKSRKLSHLPYISSSNEESQTEDISLISITKDATLLLVDTSGCELFETVNGAGSRYNMGEAEIVVKHVKNLIQIGMKPQDIAVITPYNGQVEVLRNMLLEEFPKLEIRSVDGFQGGEREAVILSLVRSSDRGKDGVGFLKDERRLNVAVTRAKRQVAVVCDCDTVGQNEFLKGLITWMEDNGEYLSAMEYLEPDTLVSNEALLYSVLESIDDGLTAVPALGKKDVMNLVLSSDGNLNAAPNSVAECENNAISQNVSTLHDAKDDLEQRLSCFAEIADDGEEIEVSVPSLDISMSQVNSICIAHGLHYEVLTKSQDRLTLSVLKASGGNENEVTNRMDDLKHALASFSNTTDNRDAYHLPMASSVDPDRLEELCKSIDLLCLKEPGFFVIHRPKESILSSQQLPTKENVDTSCADARKSMEKAGNHNISTDFVDDTASSLSDGGIATEALSRENGKQESTNDEPEDVKNKNKSNINVLLSSLAKDREARAQRDPSLKQVETKSLKQKNSKKTGGRKLGGSKISEKPKPADDMSDLDDLAFLNAQIEKVQNSHGRKIEGSSNYKTIVNGILLAKPKPVEKKRDPKAANALSLKLKQAQDSRKPKQKKK